ncbi:MAG: type II toxin-antitoxin system RelB/DinJ family antitoxin [Eggerthellaceae bacterium]|nr:type II toxin-antitoxin system RelB/DinJ family antitoxin [Eggerthellaceae bacterium]
MAQSVNVNFKLDENVKKSMEQVCGDIGLSMSAAFTIFAKKVAHERRIPFELSAPADPFFLEGNVAYLEQKMHEFSQGRATLAEHPLAEDIV